jgi:hypothetical protein
MDIRIERIRSASSEEWDAIWRDCGYATYFHSREWAEIWSRYKQGELRPNPLLVRFSDGKRALLPLSCAMWPGGSGKSFVSSPDGGYGGWIAVDPIGNEHAILMTEFMTTELGHLFWYINPFDDLVAAAGLNVDTHGDETHMINLEGGFDAVYRGWKHQCRNSERKARRSGVSVKLAQTEEEWREYYHVYEDSIRRWGDQALGQGYGWALLQAMFDRQTDHVKLWLATANDKLVVAGVLVFYAKAHALAWHAAALEAYFALRPYNRLYYEIMRHACGRGCRWFDFGPSGGLDGVRRFKESFGARPLDCAYVDIEPETWEAVAY